jgi:myo-inositol-1-phosphate synthase
MKKLGVVIVGLNGAVASTLIAGVELMKRGLVPKRGMITERTEHTEALTSMLDFAALDELVFAGWDVRFGSVFEAARHHRVFSAEQLAAVQQPLEQLQAWPAVFAQRYAENVQGDRYLRASHRDELAAIRGDIEGYRKQHQLERVVLVNLASTEAFQETSYVHESLAAFEAALDADDPAVTPLMRYIYAANQLGIAHVNFTPSLANVPALEQQAIANGAPYAGMDGKTGQTLLKTALAPMFRVRQLHVEGWYSTNFLGNNDGLILNSPSSNKTKVLSKAAVLDSIVGYPVENHQVHIHYYKPRGDSKEAWDNIDIQGFAGIPMQLKVNFLCQDSALAAPLVIDLVRLLDVAKRAGEVGIQRQLSLFFKSPYRSGAESPVHDLFEQERLLLQWAREKSTKARTNGHSLQLNGTHVNGVHANGHDHTVHTNGHDHAEAT